MRKKYFFAFFARNLAFFAIKIFLNRKESKGFRKEREEGICFYFLFLWVCSSPLFHIFTLSHLHFFSNSTFSVGVQNIGSIAEKFEKGVVMLNRFLILSFVLGSIIFAASPAEAKTSNSVTGADPQWQSTRYENRRWRNRRARVVNRTRYVRIGGRLYREIWQYRYLPNGRVTTRLLSRTRVYRRY